MEEATHGRLGRPTAHLLLPCRSDSVPVVRALLSRDLERWDVPEEVADAILLASGEAVTNAVVHGSWGQQDSAMVVRWAMTGGKFSFSVTVADPHGNKLLDANGELKPGSATSIGEEQRTLERADYFGRVFARHSV